MKKFMIMQIAVLVAGGFAWAVEAQDPASAPAKPIVKPAVRIAPPVAQPAAKAVSVSMQLAPGESVEPMPTAAEIDEILSADPPVDPAPVEAPLESGDFGGISSDMPMVQVVDTVVLPEPEGGMSAYEAIGAVIGQLQPPKTLNDREMLTTNQIGTLKTTATTYYTTNRQTWTKVLTTIVDPHGLDFLDEGEIVFLGPKEKIRERSTKFRQDELLRNRTPIEVNFSREEMGTVFILALNDIADLAGINVNYDYMNEEDRRLPAPAPVPGTEGTVTNLPVKRTTYATPKGQKTPWFEVLTQVLGPKDYGFIMEGGVVLIKTKTAINDYYQEQINAQPVVTRWVRLYHANPKTVLKQLEIDKDRGGILKFLHKNAFVKIAGDFEGESQGFKYPGPSAGTISASAGTAVGGDAGSFSGFKALNRPRTPPALIIGDVSNNLDRLVAEIQKLDQRERQVVVEARIVDISMGELENIGLNWDKLQGSLLADTGYERTYEKTRDKNREANRTDERLSSYNYADEDSTLFTSSYGDRGEDVEGEEPKGESGETTRSVDRSFTRTIEDGAIDVVESARNITELLSGQAILTPFELGITWNLLRKSADSTVISQPVLVIGDHSEAVIYVGNTLPIYNRKVEFIGTENPRPVETFEWMTLQTGITLWVIPEISEDGQHVRLAIHPQYTTSEGYVEDPDGSRYPILGSRELDTRVTVPDGHTLLLGGLVFDKKDQGNQRIPFLSAIPGLGRLFRSDNEESSRRNLIILLTPTILNDEKPASGYEQPTLKRSDPELLGLGRDLGNPNVDEVGRPKTKLKEVPADQEELLVPAESMTMEVPVAQEEPVAPAQLEAQEAPADQEQLPPLTRSKPKKAPAAPKKPVAPAESEAVEEAFEEVVF